MIKILCVGQIRKSYLAEGIEYYKKQIPYKTEILEVEDGKDEKSLVEEGNRILKKLKSDDHVIVLAINGEMMDSLLFSGYLDSLITNVSKRIVFIIGGSHGLSDEVLKRSDKTISLSKMTFPHQLTRLILMEQLFRAFSIMNNHPYHK